MTDSLALRFADFGRDTIGEHESIMRGADGVWWGWWKKAREDWPSFIEDYASRVPMTIYLVNYRTFDLYEASCLEISFAEGARLRSPDPKLTPEYYRESEMPAWFKLSNISRISLGDFVNKWGSLPSKPITIWELHEQPDRKRPRGAVELPEPWEVEVNGDVILHLSDLHLGEEHGWTRPGKSPKVSDPLTLSQAIGADLDRLPEYDAPAVVIISGDLWTRGNPRGGPTFRTFARELCERLELKAEQLVFVPGNHDIDRRGEPDEYYDFKSETTYEETYEWVLGRRAGSHLSDLRYFKLSNGLVVRIAALNSCRVLADLPEYGWVGMDQFLPLFQRVARDTVNSTGKSINIAVLHHHLVPVTYQEQIPGRDDTRPVSLTLDAEAILRSMLRCGFKLALHGHQHQPFFSRETRIVDRVGLDDAYKLSEDDYVYVVGCGSTGARIERCAHQSNFYNIYSISKGRLRVHTRQLNPSEPDGITFRDGITQLPVVG